MVRRPILSNTWYFSQHTLLEALIVTGGSPPYFDEQYRDLLLYLYRKLDENNSSNEQVHTIILLYSSIYRQYTMVCSHVASNSVLSAVRHQERMSSTERRFFFFLFFFHLTYSRWTSSLPSCLWSQRIFPSLPGSRLTMFLSRCKFSTLTTRQPMVEFYILTFPRFPLRKKEHKSYFGKNRTHDFRTSRCAAYLLDHSGDERYARRNRRRNVYASLEV